MKVVGLGMLVAFLGLPVPWSQSPAESHPQVTFEGNESFTDPQLLTALRRFRVELGTPPDITQVDDAAYFVGEFYRHRGFPDAEVTYEYTRGTAVLTIREGPQLFLGTLRVEGAHVLTEERVKDIMEASIRQATLNPFGRLRFVKSAVEAGLQAIQTVYAQNGYLQAVATAIEEPVGNDGMNVTLQLNEGPLFRVTAVEFFGGDVHHSALQQHLAADLGAPLTPDMELLQRTRVLDYLRNQGYYQAEVIADKSINETTHEATLIFQLDPGPIFHIGKVTVSGQQFTQTRAILQRYGVRSGHRYNAKAINQAAQRLWFSGAFSEAEAKMTPREGGWLDVELLVVETRAKQITTTVGAGQWERVFADITYVDRNFLGTLNRFSARGYVSTRSYGAQFTLSNPWMFNTETIGSVGAFFFRNELPAYRALIYGGILGLERRFSQTRLTGYRLSYQWKRLAELELYGFDSDTNESEQPYTVGMVQWTQTLDRRNDLLIPMQGYLLRYEAGAASEALLGDQSFFRFTGQATYYQPLREITKERPLVPFLTFNHRAGLILPYGNTSQVPIPERFFLGGADTVRSFQFDGMAPRDSDGDPLGGQFFLLGNAELQWPIWRAVYVAGFMDVGNLASSYSDFDWNETRVGVGPGLRFYTPIGAVRVDYGHNLIRRDGDPIGAWQFGFGFTF